MNLRIISSLLLSLMCSAAMAISLSIPKTLIDGAVAKKFPKEKLTITLDKPSTKFNKDRQKIELCGTWASKVPQRSGEFCVDTQPVWNKAKGDIEISKVNILKLTAGDDKELPSAVASTLNATLLTLLDGTSVYHVPDMVGKRLESIEVQESSFKLIF
ncbi:MAG: hypothetical protein EBQ86_08840 [Betaproteobacteria bacterium]|jgi:hypothetical protein|nr:hypothetical protein [Burkholderiales bacterium]NBX90183.1 hypothetical protein [Betaproteobacteria bacterium]